MSGKRIHLCSPVVLMVEEEAKVTEKQGIVSILGSDSEQTKASSLRRTLSADMSSKKWLTQHGFSSYSPMKKIASSEELALTSLSSTADSSFSSSEEGEEDEEHELRKSKLDEKPSQNDIWSLILSQKDKEDSSKLQPPYVHPLVKKSKSSLNDKSLQICTESLGSETGSEGFSSYPSSESSDGEEDKEEAQTQTQVTQEEKESRFLFDREESQVIKYNYYTNKKSPLKSFPPPLPSLPRCEGPSLLMQSHRENGRLVLEAVRSVPCQNYFRAHREDGRLLLSFSNRPSEEPTLEETIDQREDEVEEIEEELFQNFEEEEEEKDNNEVEEEDDDDDEEGEEMVEKIGGEEIGIMMEREPKLSSGVINVHRSALMMKKLMGLDNNRIPTWPNKYNKSVNLVEMMEVEEGPTPTQLAQSLPRPPRVARLIPSPPATATGAASFNAYEYFWRTKPTVATLINPISQQGPAGPVKINKQLYEQQEMVLLRGNKADYLVPLMKGCKESRRSLLIWEPYCIATS